MYIHFINAPCPLNLTKTEKKKKERKKGKKGRGGRKSPAKMQPTDQISIASEYFFKYNNSGARYHLDSKRRGQETKKSQNSRGTVA